MLYLVLTWLSPETLSKVGFCASVSQWCQSDKSIFFLPSYQISLSPNVCDKSLWEFKEEKIERKTELNKRKPLATIYYVFKCIVF